MASSNKNKQQEPFVAIDIGAYSVKFVYIERNDESSATLKSLAQIIVPSYEKDLTEDQREQMSRDDVKEYCIKELRQLLTTHITELLYDNNISTKKVITFASNREVTVRCIEVVPPNEKEKNKFGEMVEAEANKQMPFSMGNAVLDYTIEGEIIKDDKPLVQIMAAALQKDTVDFVGENLKGAGLTLDGILTLPNSLQLSLKKQLEPFSENDKKVAIIHCGHSTTSVMIFKNNKIQFYRDINMAGAMITDSIYAGGEVDGQQLKPKSYSEATELKHKLGVIPPDDVASLNGLEKFAAVKIFECVEKIFQNIQLSISFYISQSGETSGIDKVILTGGTAAMNNFKEYIEESLEVSTELANPYGSMKIGPIKYEENKRIADATSLSPILGVGLYSESSEIVNFLDVITPGKSKKNTAVSSINFSGVSSKFGSNLNDLSSKLMQLDENKLRIIAAVLVLIVIIIAIIPILSVNNKLNNIKNEYKKLDKELAKMKEEQSEVDKLLREQEYLSKFVNLDQQLKSYKILYTKLIISLISVVPNEIFITEANFKLDSNNPTIEIQGHADKSDSIFMFQHQLGQNSIFVNPDVVSAKEEEIDADRYFITFVFRSGINLKELHPEEEKKEGEEEEEESEEEEE